MRRTLLISAGLLILAASHLEAAARLTYLMQQKPTAVFWPSASFPISYQLSREALRDLPDADAVVDRAVASWSGVAGSAATFRKGGVSEAGAGKDGRNVIAVNQQLFSQSGFLAFTTSWFDESGKLQESDIQIDPTALRTGVSFEGLVQHELGHLLGLDHSAVLTSAMYPFVGVSAPPLESDDKLALAAFYPSGTSAGTGGSVRGRVSKQSGGIFGAQVVAVNAQGSPLASALTDSSGAFELKGLPAGSYTLYAEPLDGPVDGRNLSGVYRELNGGFRTEFAPQLVEVQNGQVHDGVAITSDSLATLNPRWVGAFPIGSTDIQLASTPMNVRAGERISLAIGGDGVLSGVTVFEIPGAGFRRISEFEYGGNYVRADFAVAGGATPGPVVVLARNGSEAAALTGALRVMGGTLPPARRRRPA